MVCGHRLGEPEPSGLPGRRPRRVLGRASRCAWRPGDRGAVRLVDCPNWRGTIHHGLPTDLYALGSGSGGYLAFIGRICPEKRPDRAIAIAHRAGLPLRIAAKVDKVDRAYLEAKIKPLL